MVFDLIPERMTIVYQDNKPGEGGSNINNNPVGSNINNSPGGSNIKNSPVGSNTEAAQVRAILSRGASPSSVTPSRTASPNSIASSTVSFEEVARVRDILESGCPLNERGVCVTPKPNPQPHIPFWVGEVLGSYVNDPKTIWFNFKIPAGVTVRYPLVAPADFVLNPFRDLY